MAISSNATGLRPGVCTSTTRPTAPYTGQLIFETDTFKLQFWNGSAWQGAVSAPAGTVEAYAGSTAPTGWLLCAGQAVSRSTYADLFAVVSTTYGTGDGSTTFNLPDLRGRVAAGKDDMGGSAASRLTSTTITSGATTLGNSGGAQTYTLATSEIPSHNHTQVAHTHTFGVVDPDNAGTNGFVLGQADRDGQYGYRSSGGGDNTTSTGGGGAHGNVQPTIILNYIIKF